MSISPLRAGQSPGTVAAQARVNGSDSRGARDMKSSASARLLTLQDVAERCACSYWTVREWVDAGKLRVLRLPGRLVRVEPSELDAFLQRCR